VEAGARYETSKLKQSGDANLTRELSFLKPHGLLTWEPTAEDEVRLLYERTAGQLDFKNFVSSVQLSSAQVTGGNPSLLPYTQWRTELVWEHRFEVGSLVLTARQDAIKNVLDRIALTSAAGTLDASGNLQSGQRQEFVANINLPLDWAMLDGVTVRSSWLQRFSHTIDPTTGVKRNISGDAPAEATFDVIKDIPAIQMRWGATYTHEVDRRTFRFNEFRRDDMPEQIEAFVEYKPTPQWLIRLFAQNLTDRPVARIRDIYPGPRNTAIKSYTEIEKQSTGPRVGLNIQRTFGG
jgi:outer membrane receptor protein involved in Fe transport